MGDLGIGEIISAASAVASIAGTGLSLEAGAEAQNKMNKNLSAQLDWQKQFQKQGQGVLQKHISDSSPDMAKKEIGQGGNAANQRYNELQGSPVLAGSSSSVAPSASTAVVGDDAKARSSLLNDAAAPVQGLNDWQVQQWIDDLKARTKLGQINQFSQMASSILPAQLEGAQHSHDALAGIGSLLNTLGGLGGIFGASFGNKSAPKTTSSSSNNTSRAFGGSGGTYPPKLPTIYDLTVGPYGGGWDSGGLPSGYPSAGYFSGALHRPK